MNSPYIPKWIISYGTLIYRYYLLKRHTNFCQNLIVNTRQPTLVFGYFDNYYFLYFFIGQEMYLQLNALTKVRSF